MQAAPARYAGGRDEHEPSNALRPSRSQVGGDRTAERVADEVDPVETQCVEPAGEPRAELRGRRIRRRPRQIDGVHAPMRGERLDEPRPPAERPCQPVDEDERLPRSRRHVTGRPTTDGDV